MKTIIKRSLKLILMLVTAAALSAGINPGMTTAASPAPVSTNATLSGFVKDLETGETLVGATIAIKNSKKGAYTNKSGFFSINDITPGQYTIRVTMVGYEPLEEKISVSQKQALRNDYTLKPNSITTGEVSVEASREVERRSISISKVNIPVKQIKEIRIGGESDIFRSIQMLPGVLTSSQISSGLYIRGGSPDQNLVLLDGSTVYNPSHLFGFISAFNSDAIKDVDLIKGGYPAEFGSRLSSVLAITQKDGNTNKFAGNLSVGAISSKISLEGPLGLGSYFIGGRRTYFDIIKGAIDNDPQNPIPDFGFYDVNAKLTQNLSQNDKMSVSGFLSRDNFDIDGNGFNINMYMGNKSGALHWNHIFCDNLFAEMNLTGSQYQNSMLQNWSGYKISVRNSITDYTVKGSIESFTSDELTLKAGFELSNYIFSFKNNFSGEDGDADEGTNEGAKANILIHDWVYSLYGQGNYRLSDLVSMQFGLRYNFWDKSENTTFDPRIAMRWQIQDNFAIKASYGVFHQYLRLAGDENFSLFDMWLPTDNSVKPSQATHYILSFETRPVEDIDFNFDLYYKNLDNISEMNKTQMGAKEVSDIFYTGKGRAYGAEIFLQKKVGRFAGWIGYGLGWVFAQFDSINSGNEFRPKYDRRHDLKIVAQYELNEHWLISSTFVFQSGQSYTGATSRFQGYMQGDNAGKGMVQPSQRYGLRMPASHQLNVSVSYNTRLFDLPFRMTLDVFNVYNRRDILMRSYDVNNASSALEDVRLLPILPTISFELKY